MPTIVPPAASADTTGLLGTPLSSLIARPPLALPPEATIQMGAQAMRDAGVSSVLLMQDLRLLGIVTDRDLRNRVVAQGLSPSLPLHSIASTDLRSLPPQASALDALALMAQHNIHHVPVLEQGRVLGIVTPRDVGERQSPSTVQWRAASAKRQTLPRWPSSAPRCPPSSRHWCMAAQGRKGWGTSSPR